MKTDSVRLISHTMYNEDGQLIAGYLARVRATGKDIGRVWFGKGGGWMWSSNDDAMSGGGKAIVEEAADALYAAVNLGLRARAPLLDDGPRHPSPGPVWGTAPKSQPRRAAKPAAPPAPHKQTIVWNDDAPDLTASVAAALGRHTTR